MIPPSRATPTASSLRGGRIDDSLDASYIHPRSITTFTHANGHIDTTVSSLFVSLPSAFWINIDAYPSLLLEKKPPLLRSGLASGARECESWIASRARELDMSSLAPAGSPGRLSRFGTSRRRATYFLLFHQTGPVRHRPEAADRLRWSTMRLCCKQCVASHPAASDRDNSGKGGPESGRRDGVYFI